MHSKLREGDVIGSRSIFGNVVWNFFRLWYLRGFAYARKNWRRKVPTRVYMVSQGRSNGLLYAIHVGKKKGRPRVRFTALEDIGKLVYLGRSKGYDSLRNQMELNERIISLQYYLVAEFDKKDCGTYYREGIINKVLNINFIMEMIVTTYIKWEKHLLNVISTPLDIIESNNFEEVDVRNKG